MAFWNVKKIQNFKMQSFYHLLASFSNPKLKKLEPYFKHHFDQVLKNPIQALICSNYRYPPSPHRSAQLDYGARVTTIMEPIPPWHHTHTR